uniref:Uncharacterized protein MANES_06G092200 n=1 Tax=Rhizophora mucronata TaxID=61149 RepID=A0A2P2L6I2_RHIMU
MQGDKVIASSRECSSSHAANEHTCVIDIDGAGEHEVFGEDDPLIQTVECRICQEEDSIKNLEIPCACNGSLKFAHRKCVQHWCNEKGDITCEICHQVIHNLHSICFCWVYFCTAGNQMMVIFLWK